MSLEVNGRKWKWLLLMLHQITNLQNFLSVLVTLSFALLLECLIIQGENPGSREHSKNSLEL